MSQKSSRKWVYRDCVIKNSNGQVYFEKKRVQAPEKWSQTAVDIAASKYFRKSIRQENSIQALIDRIGQGLVTAFKQSEMPLSHQQIQQNIDFLKDLLLDQKAAFNSPVWFNCGLSEAYQIQSISEHYAWNSQKKQIEKITDAYKRPQTSACFIQSVDDNLESIFELVKNEAKLFKYGSGSGTNFSKLRSKYELLNSGGTSSGLISFLEVLDKSAGAIKSGGTTRRAAKMVCVDLDHPEVIDFINWKKNEEKKAKQLIDLGYSSDLDGEAYRTVSGQNANISVRIPDSFMKGLAQNKIWSLRSRSNRKVIQKIESQKIWQQICQAAWECADPGVQFDDTIQKFHTCAQTDRIYASNPCSEFMFLDNTACNLASINLGQYYNSETQFDIEQYLMTIEKLIIAQDALVDYSSYPTAQIAQNSHDYRPLGLGFANLGSLIMRMGLAYDSEQSRAWAGVLSALLTGQAYLTSAKLAQKSKPFAQYKKNKKSMQQVLKRHQAALKNIDWKWLPKQLKETTESIWQQAISQGERFGYRNSQVTAIAPTGTIGLVMDCDTTGIEPDFSLVKIKKLAGGGQIQIVNQSVQPALEKLGYSKQQIENIQKFILDNNTVVNCADLQIQHRSIFQTATGADAISAQGHLLMMAAVQPFISGAISKTVNLPQSATVEDISHVYQQAWKLGLKSITIYRDNSKFTQPLQSDQSQFPKCTECGSDTYLESGCYRCKNCGSTTSCAG